MTRIVDLKGLDKVDALQSLKGIPKLPKTNTQVELKTGEATFQVPGFHAPLVSFEKLSDSVLEMVLDITGMNWEYQSGDTFGIYSRNPKAQVDLLLSHLALQPDQLLEISNGPKGVPSLITAHDVFTFCLDIFTFPKKQFFRLLAEHASNDLERKQLFYISSTSGKEPYNFLKEQYPSLLEILQLFPSCKPPLHDLIEHLPPLAPRHYSVSQSPAIIGKSKVSFAFNLVHYPSNDYFGICTGWLDKVKDSKGITIPIFSRLAPIPFHLKLDDPSPILMIANGTGLAPFIGFIQDLMANERKATLLYGHRTKEDRLYSNILDEAVESGLLNLKECLSRDDSTPTKYVQELLPELENDVLNSQVYICGSGAMGKGVHNALVDLKMKQEGCSIEDAFAFWTEKTKNGIYLRDLWD